MGGCVLGLAGRRPDAGRGCRRQGRAPRELLRIEGLRVPAGFCVTTGAFRRVMAQAPSMDEQLDRLSRLDVDGQASFRSLGAGIRESLEGIAIPNEVTAAVAHELIAIGARAAYAVRSNATAEDLPAASWSPPTRTPAGRPFSSRSRAW
jgi:phosphoenolpyruvate synthase/pyruvate phosphate dikinase